MIGQILPVPQPRSPQRSFALPTLYIQYTPHKQKKCAPHVLMLVTYIKLINADWITVRWWEKTKKGGLNIEFLIMNLFFFHMRFMMVVL